MNSKRSLIALSVWLVATSLATAQPGLNSGKGSSEFRAELAGAEAKSSAAPSATAMYEDIEIMSRILDRAVRRIAAKTFAGGWSLDFATPVDTFARNNKGDAAILQKNSAHMIPMADGSIRLWDETQRPALTGEQTFLLSFFGGQQP